MYCMWALFVSCENISKLQLINFFISWSYEARAPLRLNGITINWNNSPGVVKNDSMKAIYIRQALQYTRMQQKLHVGAMHNATLSSSTTVREASQS